MYIKQITVSGFKSYKDKTDVEELDPGFNIIVGRNGSGKSNLFAAIEFALTLEYRNLRPPARMALLHQGRANYDPAYVEIVFDNTDRKLPVNSDTVAFRRLIAAKKDKFYCNGKELSNAKQFLDMAGLNNPYFIVKQGKVQQLAVGTDAFRLKLLEDVTGSTSCEEKLVECRKALKDADVKREEIEKCLTGLRERQASLEEEAQELKDYLKWDSKRRTIEHILNEREQDSAREALIKCDEDREELNQQQEPLRKEWQELKKEQQSVARKLQDVETDLRSVQLRKEAMEGDMLSLVAEHERLKNLKADLLHQKNQGSSKKKVNDEVTKLKKELGTAESELETAKDELELAKSRETGVEMRLISKESKLKVLESRLVGGDEFGSHTDMKKLVATIAADVSSKSKKLNELKKVAALHERAKKEASGQLQKTEEEYNLVRTELAKLQKESNLPESELFKANNSRKKMWKNLNENEQKTAYEKGARLAVMELLSKRVGRETVNGWDGVRKVIEELRRDGEDDIVDGYYGLVIENISCNDSYDLAVEAAAGNKLFHHIVKNHIVSMRIMRAFNKLKLKGAPSFIPVDELRVRVVDYPVAHQAYRPLINSVTCPPELEKIKLFIFGTVLLCRELSDASSMAKIHKLTCVTTDGDRVASNGPMTGGYLEAQQGQLELQRCLSKSNESLRTLSAEKLEIDNELERLNEFISTAGKDAQTRENKKCSLMAKNDASSSRMKRLQELLKSEEVSIANVEKEAERLSRVIHELTCRKEHYESDEASSKNTSQSNRKTVGNLRKEVKKLMQEKSKAFSDKMEKEKIVGTLSQKIQQLISLVDEENFRSLELHSSQEHRNMISELDEMVDSVQEQISQRTKESHEIGNELVMLINQSRRVRSVLDGLEDKEKELRSSRGKVEKKLDKLCTISAGLTQKLGDILKAASALGPIPSGAEDSAKQAELSSKSLYSKLNKLNKYIHGVKNINQKAVDQYKELTETYTTFKEKFEQLAQAKVELEQLILDLEAKRGNAILQNFRVLQAQFHTIFSQIVPQGVAELILYGNNFDVAPQTVDSDQIRQLIGSGDAQGVKINVDFINRRLPAMCNLMQLSGGQKSVVALCLILAIQKIDPVPFYLFDEVDQALDAQYRSSVTKVIHDLATEFHLQFICTTFRKEFLTNADKFYGVSIMNQCSTVRPVTSIEAKEFVENDSENGSGESTSGDVVMSSDTESSRAGVAGGGDEELFSPPSASESDSGRLQITRSGYGNRRFADNGSSRDDDTEDDEVLSNRFKRVRLNRRRPIPPVFNAAS